MSLQKSSSISSIDSGLDHSTKKKLKNKSSVGHKESSLQSKNEINRNMSKELETESYCSQFSPLAFSTQVKKSESTSQSSDEGEMHSGGIVRVKQFKSSDSDTELPVNTGRNKEPKIHIIDNCLINSKKELNLKEEVDSDSKSVISVRRPSYVVTSETNSEDDDSQERSSGSKSKRKKKRKSIQENLSVGQTTKYHIKLNQNNEIDNREQNLNNSSSLEDNKLQTFNSNKLKKIADRKISLYQNEDDSSDTDGDHSDQRNSGKLLNKDILKSKAASKDSAKHKQLNSKKQNEILINSKRRNDVSSSESEDSEASNNDSYRNSGPMQGLSQKTSINILQKFHNDNPDYEKIKLSDKVKLRLNEGDEVYIMQVPKTINPKILKGVSFSLSKKSKLKTEAGKYIMKQQPESPSPVLLFSNELQKVSPISTFKMEKYIKTKDQKEVLVEEKRKHDLPNNIKIRHPLFGPDYESKIKLEDEIKEKLQQALERFTVKEKKSKHKRKVKVEEDDKGFLISKILEEKFNNVNKSMSKMSSNIINDAEIKNIKTESIDEAMNETKNISKKKKKKSLDEPKLHEMSFDQIFNPKAETEGFGSFNLSHQNGSKTKTKRESGKNYLVKETELVTEKKNKVKSEHIFVKQEIKTEVESQDELEVNEVSQWKKKKRKGEPNSPSNYLLNELDMKKGKFQHGIEETSDKDNSHKNEELNVSLNNSHDVEGNIYKKKRKKKHLESNAFYLDIKKEPETESEIQESSFIEKKKKRKNADEINMLSQSTINEEPPKKKRRKSIMSSTMIGGTNISDFKVDVSRIEAVEPIIKKKKKSDASNESSVLINSLLSTVRDRLESTSDHDHKRHKKKK